MAGKLGKKLFTWILFQAESTQTMPRIKTGRPMYPMAEMRGSHPLYCVAKRICRLLRQIITVIICLRSPRGFMALFKRFFNLNHIPLASNLWHYRCVVVSTGWLAHTAYSPNNWCKMARCTSTIRWSTTTTKCLRSPNTAWPHYHSTLTSVFAHKNYSFNIDLLLFFNGSPFIKKSSILHRPLGLQKERRRVQWTTTTNAFSPLFISQFLC